MDEQELKEILDLPTAAGVKAQLKERENQYENYRNKLLTFE